MNAHASTHEDGLTFKEVVLYGTLSVMVLGGSFFIGRSIIRKARSTSEEKKTYSEHNGAYYAQKLKLAFENDMWFGWGTDEEAVRQILRSVPSKEVFKAVINSYQKLYARSLMLDLKKELTTSEYSEMLAIIAGKPDKTPTGDAPIQISTQQYAAWAKRLKAAFDITYWFMPGTDEDAIKAVFTEMPTQLDFQKTALVYKSLFGNDLINELKHELEFWEYGSYMSIINDKPKQ
jgi:hypothetical protein